MILLQLSCGQGPIECAQAVGLALKKIEKECQIQNIDFKIIEKQSVKFNQYKDCFKSILCQLGSSVNKNNKNSENQIKQFAKSWEGVMLWVCQSQHRPKHKRKNWYFSGQVFEVNDNDLTDHSKLLKDIQFQTCRASGTGGQHVNTTDSAVRATHIPSGISVRVETERSQHANKRLAKLLILQKLELQQQESHNEQDKSRWSQHWDLERGNPVRVFRGIGFR